MEVAAYPGARTSMLSWSACASVKTLVPGGFGSGAAIGPRPERVEGENSDTAAESGVCVTG